MTQLGDEELWVQACIQEALPGCPVVQHDDGSMPSMYDLQIIYPDGSIGAVEVTAAADAQQIELWKLLGGLGRRWLEPSLVGGWLIRVLPSARVRKLHSLLPSLLRDLERDGVQLIRGDRSSRERLAALAGQIDVLEAYQARTAYRGSIYVMIEAPPEQAAGYSPLTGDPLAVWLGEWLAEPSQDHNVQKVAVSGAREKHLFALVPGFTFAPFGVIDLLIAPNAPLPRNPPVLPAKVTHVWAMSTWNTGDGFRWSPEAGWARFAKVKPPDPGPAAAGEQA